ncbi:Nascent polypeptide-associated complex NAC domain protein [Raphanus sativus]|nr:Nascent polypeptide-associated complex NAC domain protein [Raphanus sativus]
MSPSSVEFKSNKQVAVIEAVLAQCNASESVNTCFLISKPDVFKSPASDTYVIFGDAKIDDLISQLQTQAAEQFKAPDSNNNMVSGGETSSGAAAASADQDEDEEVDKEGVEPKDIELVMTQAGVSKPRAVKALKAADGDIDLPSWSLPPKTPNLFYLDTASRVFFFFLSSCF